MLPDLFLKSISRFSCRPVEDKADIHTKLKELLPGAPRRLDTCIKASLIGAASCVKDIELNDADVYLSSGAISHEVMHDIIDSVLIEKEQPKPVSFIHSIGNAASFYVSQQLGLSGESLFLVETDHSLARLLLLTAVKMQLSTSSVLLGNIQEKNGLIQTSWMLLGKQKSKEYFAKISFEPFASTPKPFAGNNNQTTHRNDTNKFYQFCQQVSTNEMPEIIGSGEFQRQSGLTIKVSGGPVIQSSQSKTD